MYSSDRKTDTKCYTVYRFIYYPEHTCEHSIAVRNGRV